MMMTCKNYATSVFLSIFMHWGHIQQTFSNRTEDWWPFDVTNYVAHQFQICCLIILGNETWYVLFELETR